MISDITGAARAVSHECCFVPSSTSANVILYKSSVNKELILLHFRYNIVFFSAVKWLIAINHIQNKSYCLHNICVCAMYIYYVYINTHTCMYIFKKNILCLYIFNIFIYDIIYLNINIYMEIFSKYMLYVCLYIYIINIHSTHIHILCKQKLLFWMRLIVINRLTAQILIFFLKTIFNILSNFIP